MKNFTIEAANLTLKHAQSQLAGNGLILGLNNKLHKTLEDIYNKALSEYDDFSDELYQLLYFTEDINDVFWDYHKYLQYFYIIGHFTANLSKYNNAPKVDTLNFIWDFGSPFDNNLTLEQLDLDEFFEMFASDEYAYRHDIIEDISTQLNLWVLNRDIEQLIKFNDLLNKISKKVWGNHYADKADYALQNYIGGNIHFETSNE